MNIAIFVAYEPASCHFVNLEKVCSQFDSIVVVDNSVEFNDFSGFQNVTAIHNANRGGIAGAFNAALDQLDLNQDDFIFTLDQDSNIPPGFVGSMVSFCKAKGCLAACPDFYDVNSASSAGFAVLSGVFYQVNKHEYTDFCISSGMCVHSSIYSKVRFDNDFFIDHVDTDICFKLKEIGCSIFINRDVVLQHAIGCRSVESWLGLTIKPTRHNHIRRYFVIRNGWYLAWKYFFKYPGFFVLNVARTVHEIISVVFFEDNKIDKIVSMLKGFFHGAIGKLGGY